MKTTEHVDAKGKSPRVTGPGNAAVGFLSEIFCSIQGEGLYVGQRQVFLRTAGCALGCRWCDTPNGKSPSPRYAVYGDEKTVLPNPANPETATGEALRLAREAAPVDTVSITGGEPLEQPDFVVAVAKRLSAAGLRVYLETNGVHADTFGEILPFVDVVAMDFKLPSAVGRDLWVQHDAFLSRIKGTPFDPERKSANAAGNKKRIFVKIVLDDLSRPDELETAARVVAATSRRVPLVLQPESGTLLSKRAFTSDARRFHALIGEHARAAGTILESVRVIPQCHKILGIR